MDRIGDRQRLRVLPYCGSRVKPKIWSTNYGPPVKGFIQDVNILLSLFKYVGSTLVWEALVSHI